MAQPDNMENRVTKLEVQVSDLSHSVCLVAQDAAAAKVLATSADRNARETRSELREFRHATAASFNAMREDLTDLRQGQKNLRQEMTSFRQDVDRRFEAVDARFDEVDRGFVEMRGKFDGQAAGLQTIVSLLNHLIERDATK